MSSSYKGFWINGARDVGYRAIPHSGPDINVGRCPTIASIKRAIDAHVMPKKGDTVHFETSSGRGLGVVISDGQVRDLEGKLGFFISAYGTTFFNYTRYVRKVAS